MLRSRSKSDSEIRKKKKIIKTIVKSVRVIAQPFGWDRARPRPVEHLQMEKEKINKLQSTSISFQKIDRRKS